MIMKNHRELQKMVMQVSEVLPHVPRDNIFRDLGIKLNVFHVPSKSFFVYAVITMFIKKVHMMHLLL
ncbi:hypothetical protein PGB90_009972 [Kerria lacca]